MQLQGRNSLSKVKLLQHFSDLHLLWGKHLKSNEVVETGLKVMRAEGDVSPVPCRSWCPLLELSESIRNASSRRAASLAILNYVGVSLLFLLPRGGQTQGLLEGIYVMLST